MIKKPLKDDIVFFDKETGEKTCSFNECYQKFEEHEKQVTKWIPEVGDVTWIEVVHRCNECGRDFQTKKNRSASIDNYQHAKHEVLFGKL